MEKRPLRSDKEMAYHLHVINSLARELDVPVNDVRKCYDAELEKIDTDVKVRSYLSIFAAKQVSKLLREPVAKAIADARGADISGGPNHGRGGRYGAGDPETGDRTEADRRPVA